MRGIANREINPEVNLIQTDNLINWDLNGTKVSSAVPRIAKITKPWHTQELSYFYRVFSSFFQEKQGAGELTVLFPKGKR